MGLLDFLALGTGAASENIPTFRRGSGRDAVDLQVRSLLYLFKRLRVNRLASFSLGETLKYTDGKLWDQLLISHEAEIKKLDKAYNLSGFQKVLVEDEHRVLIDWPKNKFRALCILSEYPAMSLNSSNAAFEENALPVFLDYKERSTHSFAFSILPVKTSTSTRDLALDLAQSLLYYEHHSYVSLMSRLQTAEKAIAKFCGADIKMVELSEATKADIVHEYLKQLAFLVQLVRIYQQYVNPKDSETPLSSPKKAAVADQPRALRPAKSFLQLPNAASSPLRPSLSPKKSMASLSGSPKKLMGDISSGNPDVSPRKQLQARPSISSFRANEIYNPVTSPPISCTNSENKRMGSGVLLSHLSESGRETTELWEKCKASIREKLAKEKEQLGKA
ncbi:hypothetical protein METBIDRAFT_114121 [Metschnikowia bicuspidata var. bicuspidata NRRL YB-4993]|uniref:Uncharacterized protein n=1 Tax=Metschnikowia bicuspidata var. bicuspidata NRRL YB-4993 TaxID=869754 RepID=A0A1A0HIK0_9ASCO|nr:hypothetical protein METBIDRAFT_114121 [Metschnikowia bicuspidata var. bicuspidata NRRL YB-4993]OBA23840.1 hypothetical protein METBIDRAFT_114121 [Metschnikowia bicuspidata var. bicuspidata NRRL YB-4993]